jgi:hypothetical protein
MNVSPKRQRTRPWLAQETKTSSAKSVKPHIVNAASVEDARAVIESLPLVAEGKMTFEYVLLAPLSSLSKLATP